MDMFFFLSLRCIIWEIFRCVLQKYVQDKVVTLSTLLAEMTHTQQSKEMKNVSILARNYGSVSKSKVSLVTSELNVHKHVDLKIT